MIHTFKILMDLSSKHMSFIKDVFGHYREIPDYVDHYFNGFKVVVKDHSFQLGQLDLDIKKRDDSVKIRRKNKSGYSLEIFGDVPLILGRGILSPTQDKEAVQKRIAKLLNFVVGDESLYTIHRLTRLDYRVDYRISNASVRQLYIDLLSKVEKHRGKFNKVCFLTTCDFKTSSNSSISITIYDKPAEREANNDGKMAAWESDVLRFEIRLHNPYLSYRKSEKGGLIPKRLETYFDNNLFEFHVNQYLIPFYKTGNFYTQDRARETILACSYSLQMKRKLIKFLSSSADSHSLTGVRGNMSAPTYRDRLKKLAAISIHPVPIPIRKAKVADVLDGFFKVYRAR